MSLHAAARAAAPGHLVLYRVGEFYEVLGPDAAIVSRTLGIQLTRRHQKDAADVPMCGVPASTLDATTARLLAAGHKVAVSEQVTEDGGDRPLRLLTPGTSGCSARRSTSTQPDAPVRGEENPAFPDFCKRLNG